MPISTEPTKCSSGMGVELGRESTRIAMAAYTRWAEIDTLLSPIIGRHDMAGLYKRSVSHTFSARPILGVVDASLWAVGDYAPLQELLAHLPAATAIAFDEALLKTFNDLLSQLIGAPLIDRLIGPAV